MQITIQTISIVGPESAFGEYLETEFRVLTMHRNNVKSNPSLPGIAVAEIPGSNFFDSDSGSEIV